MDIRNFSKAVCQCEPGLELHMMFELQESLLEKYLPIENLPHWPLNVNTRSAQAILKDMSARVIEELGEGYESTTYILQQLDKLGYNFNTKWTKEDYRQLLNHLQNSNEEQADAIAFFINLLLYSNIHVDDVVKYVETKYTKVWDKLDEEPVTANLMNLGYGLLVDRFQDINDDHHQWRIFRQDVLDTFNIKGFKEIHSYSPAFNEVSWESHDMEAKVCWEISYHLSVARNYLKNKPWKQTGEMTDELRFQEELVIAFLELLGYFAFIGFTPDSLLQLRYKKHLVNEFRIKSKY